MLFKCECTLSSKTLSEWKSCTKIVDLDKLALASSLLISWLGDNLVKLDEEQCVEMVGKTTLLPSIQSCVILDIKNYCFGLINITGTVIHENWNQNLHCTSGHTCM